MMNQHVADYYYQLSINMYHHVVDSINFYKYLNEEWSQEINDWFPDERYEYDLN